MSKFIYIDHSIVKTGGHYLEYAQNVLKTVETRYDVWIATNKKYREKGLVRNYHVLPIYQYDIWGKEPDAGKKEGILPKVVKAIKAAFGWMRFRISYLLHFSLLGFFREGIHTGHFFAVENTALAVLMLCVVFLAAVLCFVPFLILRVIFKFLRAAWQKVIHRYWQLFSERIFKRMRISEMSDRERISKAFANGTKRILQKASISEGDIIFIPTLSMNDLHGVHEVLKTEPKAQKCSWHLLFRRNVFQGREPEYMDQILTLSEYQQEFANMAGFNNVFFYTDTETLTRQYNRLTGMNFCTLPIPIYAGFQNGEYLDLLKPYKIIYIGDARSEKGYQFIPDLVEKLYDEIEKGQLCFDLQSNFTFRKPSDDAPVVSARERLSEYPSEQVALRMEPMESAEYCRMVKEAAVGLLMYDRDNYYARSSGALVECLGSGCPVVVPSGSWLSDQIMPAVTEHQLGLSRKFSEKVIVAEKSSRWLPESVAEKLMQSPFLTQSPLTNKNRLVNLIKMFGESFELDKEALEDEMETLEDMNNLDWVFYAEELLYREKPPQEESIAAEIAIKGAAREKLLRVPPASRAIYVNYRLDDLTGKGVYVRTTFIFMNNDCYELGRVQVDNARLREDGQCTAVARIPKNTCLIAVRFHTPFSNAPAFCRDIAIRLWSEDDFPLQSTGAVFCEVDDASGCIRELLNYYSHYRASAIEFSKRWNQYHSSVGLTRELIDADRLWRTGQ